MKKAILIFSLFVLIYGISSAQAQMAYDNITYKTTIYGDRTTLQLADGYLLASKITIHSKFGDQVFASTANEPDDQGDLRFDAVKGTGSYKDNKGSWLMLKKLTGQQYSSQIKAIYWDGKMKNMLVFKKQ